MAVTTASTQNAPPRLTTHQKYFFLAGHAGCGLLHHYEIGGLLGLWQATGIGGRSVERRPVVVNLQVA